MNEKRMSARPNENVIVLRGWRSGEETAKRAAFDTLWQGSGSNAGGNARSSWRRVLAAGPKPSATGHKRPVSSVLGTSVS